MSQSSAAVDSKILQTKSNVLHILQVAAYGKRGNEKRHYPVVVPDALLIVLLFAAGE